jgi:methylglutaconyl-CoA hydratase
MEAYFLGIADRLVEIPEEEDGMVEGPRGKEDMLKRAGHAVKVEAIELAKEICTGGPVAIRAAIEAVAWAREEVENKCYEKVLRTTDRDEALAAFREKRRPKFTGN